jgi:hypothetical protein
MRGFERPRRTALRRHGRAMTGAEFFRSRAEHPIVLGIARPTHAVQITISVTSPTSNIRDLSNRSRDVETRSRNTAVAGFYTLPAPPPPPLPLHCIEVTPPAARASSFSVNSVCVYCSPISITSRRLTTRLGIRSAIKFFALSPAQSRMLCGTEMLLHAMAAKNSRSSCPMHRSRSEKWLRSGFAWR